MAMKADERKTLFQERRMKMLSEKVDCAKFLTWFIRNIRLRRWKRAMQIPIFGSNLNKDYE